MQGLCNVEGRLSCFIPERVKPAGASIRAGATLSLWRACLALESKEHGPLTPKRERTRVGYSLVPRWLSALCA